MRFKDRHEAGVKLAEQLKQYKNNKDAIVLAIPRGGVEVGYEIAKSLNIELDVLVSKKIGLPGDPEFAIGSVGPDKKVSLNNEAVRIYNVSKDYIKKESKEIGNEIERRYKAYRGKHELSSLKGKIAILVDDGIATGYTIKACANYILSQNPKKAVVAVPVAPLNFRIENADFICLHSAERLSAVSQFYDIFPQLSDEDVKKYLKEINAKNQ